MFTSSNPPLLVQPVPKDYSYYFLPEEGFEVHPMPGGDVSFVAYREGWTFPVFAQHMGYIADDKPMLMVKNNGGITSNTSTSKKGFAHIFCSETGKELQPFYKRRVFSPESEAEWIFMVDPVIMIWFQYCENSEFIGDSYDAEKFCYGKMLIRKLEIREYTAPSFDANADFPQPRSRQLTVGTTKIYTGGWNVKNEDPVKCLNEIMSVHNLTEYRQMINDAFLVASGNFVY